MGKKTNYCRRISLISPILSILTDIFVVIIERMQEGNKSLGRSVVVKLIPWGKMGTVISPGYFSTTCILRAQFLCAIHCQDGCEGID